MATDSENVKIRGAENCGNSPKNELLRDLTIAFVKNDRDFFMDWMSDDLVWEIVGEKKFEGKDAFEDALIMKMKDKITELTLENVITHGKTGAVNGTVKLENNKQFAFCDVYTFKSHSKNSKIQSITSYIIQIS